MGALIRLIAIGLSMFSAMPLTHAQEANLCEREMTQAASKYKVPLGIFSPLD